MTLLTLERVACMRGGRTLFEDLSLTLDAGGAALVTGPNGAGKSSLLRISAGLLRPSAGTADRAGCALVDSRPALDPELPLARALGFWAAIDRASPTDALAALALDHLGEVPVRLLSTGQRQRAALARVVASAAPLWLLDEPANGLDSVSLAALERCIAVHRASGGAVVVATHIPVALPGATMVAL